MSLALYRKYRPSIFADVIGQEHVTTPLSNALESGKIHHAYYLVGQEVAVRLQVLELWRAHLTAKKVPHQTHVVSANHVRI